MDILFNNEGLPLMMTSSLIYGESIGKVTNEEVNRRNILAPLDQENKEIITVGSHNVLSWGKENKFPQMAGKTISETTVLNTGLKFLRNLTIGQGIYPCSVNGYDDDGNEILEPFTDPKVTEFINSRVVRRYMEQTLRDYLKFGNGAVHFIPSIAQSSFAGINTIN